MKKFTFLFLFILCNCLLANAQNSSIDQYRNALKTAKEDTNKVKNLYQLGWELKFSKPDTSIILAKQAAALAEKLNWKKGLGVALGNLGTYYRHKADYKQALEYNLKALKEYEVASYKKGIATAYGSIGLVYADLADYPKSIEYSTKALKINEEIKDKSGMASNYGSIGHVYRDKVELNKALDYYLKALKLNEEIDDKVGISIHLGNIGLIYRNQSNFTKALDYYFKSLKINDETNNKLGSAVNYTNIGNIYMSQKEYLKALEYHTKALKLNEELGRKSSIASNLGNIGNVYGNIGDNAKALDYFLRSKKISEEVGNKQGVAGILINIGTMYVKQGESQKALETFLKSLEIFESLGNKNGIAENLKSIGSLHTKTGKFKEAEEYLQKAVALDSTIGSLEGVLENEVLLSELYDTTGKHQQALLHYKKAMVIKDSIFNTEKNKELTRKEMSYEYDKKEAIAKVEFEKEKAITSAELERNRLMLNQHKQNLLLMSQENELSNLKLETQQIELEKKEVETKAKENEIELLSKEKKIKEVEAQKKEEEIAKQQLEINAKRNQQYALIVFLLLIALFAGFIYNRFKLTQKQKVIIEHQKELVEEKHKEIQDSINYAKRIQDAIMPSLEDMLMALKNGFILYQPKDVVAGDFFWMEKINNVVYFAAADCTGHGVPGAMVSVVCSNALTKALLEEGIRETGKLLDRTRELVIERFAKSGEEVKDGMDISLCALNIETNELQWSGANNPLWIIRNNNIVNPTLLETKPDKQPIGKSVDVKPFTTHQLKLEKEDTIYIFTDGYADQFGGEKGKKFKAAQLKETILSIQQKPLHEQKEILKNTFASWKGSLEQVDDVCVIGVRV